MKKSLSLRFSRAVETYESWALPQRYTAQKLAEFIDRADTLLDVGCGTGFVSLFLRDKVRLSVGLDLSPQMVEAYKERFGRAVVGDAESLPFKDKSFDAVVSNFSLHWTDVRRSVKEALRVARSRLLISLPVKGSLDGLGFPYPSESDILGVLSGYEILVSDIREVEVPFRGWNLVRFFHYTGTSLNPGSEGRISKRAIEEKISSLRNNFFRVMFLSVELRR